MQKSYFCFLDQLPFFSIIALFFLLSLVRRLHFGWQNFADCFTKTRPLNLSRLRVEKLLVVWNPRNFRWTCDWFGNIAFEVTIVCAFMCKFCKCWNQSQPTITEPLSSRVARLSHQASLWSTSVCREPTMEWGSTLVPRVFSFSNTAAAILRTRAAEWGPTSNEDL